MIAVATIWTTAFVTLPPDANATYMTRWTMPINNFVSAFSPFACLQPRAYYADGPALQ